MRDFAQKPSGALIAFSKAVRARAVVSFLAAQAAPFLRPRSLAQPLGHGQLARRWNEAGGALALCDRRARV
eukprot:2658055-Pleurochrysis_carterae.AAC.1